MSKRYQRVNGTWPEGTREGRALKPAPQEAVTAARRLYRFAMKRPFRGKVKLTSGNRFTWVRRGVLYVNPDFKSGPPHSSADGAPVNPGGGWHELVHAMSHYCARCLYPNQRPHDGRHAFLEQSMIEHIVNSGWLEGKLKPPERRKRKIDLRQVRYERIEARIAAWEAKRRRAERALRNLRQQVAYYKQNSAESI